MMVDITFDALLAAERRLGVASTHTLPRGRVLSRAEAVGRFPALGRQSLTGAALWHDYVTVEADRLTLAFALAADEHGAVLANHLEASTLATHGRRVAGVRATDGPTGRQI